MRKNLILVLLFVFAFLLKSESVFASSASIELKGDGAAVVGDKFDITMEVDSEESLSGIETYIFYDDDKVEFLSADDGIAGGKGVLRVNIRDFEDIKGKLTYKMKFLARKAGSFTLSFSDEVHLYAIDTDDEISVASRDMEMRVKSKRNASSDSSLANIRIAGGKLVPAFSKSVLDYTVNVGADVDNITIGIEPSDANSSYNYRSSDGDKLHEGENKRTIIVTAEDGSTTTYTIRIIKAAQTDTEIAEATGTSVKTKDETSSEITSKSAISEKPEYVPDPPGDNNQPETNIKDSKQTVIYVIIGAVVILGIMLGLGATLYVKNKNNDENED